MALVREFEYERSTKTKFRFRELGDDQDLGTIYVSRDAFEGRPYRVRLTLEELPVKRTLYQAATKTADKFHATSWCAGSGSMVNPHEFTQEEVDHLYRDGRLCKRCF